MSPWAIVGVAAILTWLFFMLLIGTEYLYKLLRVAGIMAIVGALVLPSIAHAQTNTPTPTRTATPTRTPTVTPTYAIGTPTPYNTPSWPTPMPTATPLSFGSTVVWGCLMYSVGAPICTWDNYFEIGPVSIHKTGFESPATWWWPVQDDSAATATIVFIPPVNTRQLVAECSVILGSNAYRGGTGSGSATGAVDFKTWGTYIPLTTDSGNSVSKSTGAGAFTLFQYDTDALTDTSFYTWTLQSGYSAWPMGDMIPTSDATKTNYARFEVKMSAGANGSYYNEAFSTAHAACIIRKVVRLDGSEYVPTVPIVGDAPTATPVGTPAGTPTTCYIGCEFSIDPYPTFAPIPIGTIAIPTVATTITFGIATPTISECYEIIPGGLQTVSTWFGDYPLGIEDVQVCTRERAIGLVIDEFDIGTWAMSLFGIMGMGVLWVMFRR